MQDVEGATLVMSLLAGFRSCVPTLPESVRFNLKYIVKTIETQKVKVAPLQESASPTSSVRRTQALLNSGSGVRNQKEIREEEPKS